PLVILTAAAPAPPPIRPVTPPIAASTPTLPQSTLPLADFCDQIEPPAPVRAPAIIAAPMGPPTPVAMTASPPTISAPAALYSQLSLTQFPAAAMPLPMVPRFASR